MTYPRASSERSHFSLLLVAKNSPSSLLLPHPRKRSYSKRNSHSESARKEKAVLIMGLRKRAKTRAGSSH
jgi:hypothetical protein